MRFISIDFGLSTGYAYFIDGKIEHINSYSIVSDFSHTPIYIVEMFFDLTKELEKDVDFYVVEDYSYGRKFFNTTQAEIIGVFKHKVYLEGKKGIYFLNSKTARKSVIGKGDAGKGDIKKFIIKNYRLKCRNQHEYDAVLIGLGFLKLLERNEFSEAFVRRAFFDRNEIKNS